MILPRGVFSFSRQPGCTESVCQDLRVKCFVSFQRWFLLCCHLSPDCSCWASSYRWIDPTHLRNLCFSLSTFLWWEPPLSTKNSFYLPRNKTLPQAGRIHLTSLLGSADWLGFTNSISFHLWIHPLSLHPNFSLHNLHYTSGVRFPDELEDGKKSRFFSWEQMFW